MHMFFWLGIEIKNFIFQGFNVITIWGFLSTCFGLAALAIFYEIMKISQIKLQQSVKRYEQVPCSNQPTDSSSLLSRVSERSITSLGSINCNATIEIIHWTFHVTLGYLLMLAVMTYNGYISIALIIGSGIGYYVFGPILLNLRLKKLQQQRKNSSKSERCDPQCADVVPETDLTVPVVPESRQETKVVNINIDADIHI